MQNPDATPRFRHPAWGRPEDPAPLAEFPLRERVLDSTLYKVGYKPSDT